jgi:hypothetical protein
MTEVTHANASFHVMLDANIWVSEHLLQTTSGSALLYAVSAARANLVLPEIVELELEIVLRRQAETAIGDIRKRVQLLTHLSGDSALTFSAPSLTAVQEGMRARLDQLSGVIRRFAFTEAHARRALGRILKTLPPSGQNNEQFRDCCIWETALEVAQERPTYLITNDAAFYKDRDRTRGLATLLQTEANKSSLSIHLYHDLGHFLSHMGQTISGLNEEILEEKIMTEVMPTASAILERINASNPNPFILGDPHRPRVKGFATLKTAVFAVSFEIEFPLMSTEVEKLDATFIAEGTCSYDAKHNDNVSEIEIDSVGTRIGGFQLRWGAGTWQDPGVLEVLSRHAQVMAQKTFRRTEPGS